MNRLFFIWHSDWKILWYSELQCNDVVVIIICFSLAKTIYRNGERHKADHMPKPPNRKTCVLKCWIVNCHHNGNHPRIPNIALYRTLLRFGVWSESTIRALGGPRKNRNTHTIPALNKIKMMRTHCCHILCLYSFIFRMHHMRNIGLTGWKSKGNKEEWKPEKILICSQREKPTQQ